MKKILVKLKILVNLLELEHKINQLILIACDLLQKNKINHNFLENKAMAKLMMLN